MSVENEIELLWKCAQTLPNEQHVHKLLKSYYMNTCRRLAQQNLQIPKEKFGISQMCVHCGSFWSDIEYGLKWIPKQIKSRSKAQKLIEQLERSKETNNNMSKRSRNRAKWLKKKISNHLAIKCFQCQRNSFIKIENPKCKSSNRMSNLAKESIIDAGNDPIECKSKKIVQSCTPKKGQEKSKKSKSKKKKQENANTSGLNNKEKPLKNTVSKKIISKTQKQNSLLQLAALLQKQSKVCVKNSTEKRLETLLK